MSVRTMLRVLTGKPAAVVLPAADPFSDYPEREEPTQLDELAALNRPKPKPEPLNVFPDALCLPDPTPKDAVMRKVAMLFAAQARKLSNKLLHARNPAIRDRLARRIRCHLIDMEHHDLVFARCRVGQAIDWMDSRINGSEEGTAILRAIVAFRIKSDIAHAYEEAVVTDRRALYRHEYRAILSRAELNRKLRAINADDVEPA